MPIINTSTNTTSVAQNQNTQNGDDEPLVTLSFGSGKVLINKGAALPFCLGIITTLVCLVVALMWIIKGN